VASLKPDRPNFSVFCTSPLAKKEIPFDQRKTAKRKEAGSQIIGEFFVGQTP